MDRIEDFKNVWGRTPCPGETCLDFETQAGAEKKKRKTPPRTCIAIQKTRLGLVFILVVTFRRGLNQKTCYRLNPASISGMTF